MAKRAGLRGASVVVEALDGPRGPDNGVRRWVLDPRRPLYPASMIKTPIAAALVSLWESGELPPGGRVAVTAANMTPNDKPSPLVPGYEATLEELGSLMLTRSDNVATNVLIDVLGRDRITAIAAGLGLARTGVRRKLSGSLPLIVDPEAAGRNTHPAEDAAALFALIARRQVACADWLLATLFAQEWNTKLSRGLRRGDRFAHKTGDTDEVAHDGGLLVLESGQRFVVVVYTALESTPEADDRFAAFMTALRPELAT